MIEITDEDFDVNDALLKLKKEGVGAIVTFMGTVRDFAEVEDPGGARKKVKVKELLYESYRDMALQEMSRIEKHATANFDIDDVFMVHRTGLLKPSDRIVLIAVSAAHRKAAFSACEYIIDELKRMVPIWKKEITDHDEYWVGGQREKEE